MAFPRSSIVLTAFSFVSLTLFLYVYFPFSFISHVYAANTQQQPLVQQEYQVHYGKRVAIIGNHLFNSFRIIFR